MAQRTGTVLSKTNPQCVFIYQNLNARRDKISRFKRCLKANGCATVRCSLELAFFMYSLNISSLSRTICSKTILAHFDFLIAHFRRSQGDPVHGIIVAGRMLLGA